VTLTPAVTTYNSASVGCSLSVDKAE